MYNLIVQYMRQISTLEWNHPVANESLYFAFKSKNNNQFFNNGIRIYD